MKTVNDLYNEGNAARDRGDLQEAFNIFNQCVAAAPNEPSFRLHLSIVAYQMAAASDPLRELAYHHANQAVQISPDVVTHWIALGEISLNCFKFLESIAAYQKAVEMDPNNAKVLSVLGYAYARIGKGKESKECYERAVAINPELGDAHFLLSCMYEGADYNPAAQAFHGERGFQAANPTNNAVEACWNAAHGYLAMGDYAKGWTYFEARMKPNVTNRGQVLSPQRFKKPMFLTLKDNIVSTHTNCRVLVSHEMGLGDCFMFLRFIPMLKEKYNLEIIFECMPTIMDLARYNLPGITVIEYGHANEEDFDYHLPMMSLPLACGIDAPPWNGPYIKAEPYKVDEWRDRLNLSRPLLNLGLCWYGGARNYNSSNYETDRKRSLSYDRLAPLLALPVNFVSLQPGDKDFPSPEIKTFSDTAAIIELLDGVVSVDTAVANLAGAMGKTTWLMNRYDTCWRWSEHLQRPWYPTVQDVRQKSHGDWDPVIQHLVAELGMASDKVSY